MGPSGQSSEDAPPPIPGCCRALGSSFWSGQRLVPPCPSCASARYPGFTHPVPPLGGPWAQTRGVDSDYSGPRLHSGLFNWQHIRNVRVLAVDASRGQNPWHPQQAPRGIAFCCVYFLAGCFTARCAGPTAATEEPPSRPERSGSGGFGGGGNGHDDSEDEDGKRRLGRGLRSDYTWASQPGTVPSEPQRTHEPGLAAWPGSHRDRPGADPVHPET